MLRVASLSVLWSKQIKTKGRIEYNSWCMKLSNGGKNWAWWKSFFFFGESVCERASFGASEKYIFRREKKKLNKNFLFIRKWEWDTRKKTSDIWSKVRIFWFLFFFFYFGSDRSRMSSHTPVASSKYDFSSLAHVYRVSLFCTFIIIFYFSSSSFPSGLMMLNRFAKLKSQQINGHIGSSLAPGLVGV
jgi:hypothetical protein